MIHRLGHMIGDSNTLAGLADGRWVRAVPLPFSGGLFDRLRDCWAILREDAYAVKWPEASELEQALSPRAQSEGVG